MSSTENRILGFRSYGDTSGRDFTVSVFYSFNDKLFEIYLLPSFTGDGKDQKLLRKVNDAHDIPDESAIDAAMEPISAIAGKLCLSLCQRYASVPDRETSLEAYFQRETFRLRLADIEGQLQLIPQPPIPMRTRDFPGLVCLSLGEGVLRVNANEIEILQRLAYPHIFKVQFGEQIGFCKIVSTFGRMDKPRSLQRNFDILQKLSAAGVSTSVRIPRLMAVVQYRGRIVGIITTFISPPDDVHTLNEAKMHKFSRCTRKKWLLQIRESVGELHKLGLTWESVAPHHVLLDNCYDAWVVGLGGGFFEQWQSRETEGTIEGDLQAIQKISQFLELDEETEMR